MIVTTMNDIPGYVIDEVYGEVMGLTVRSRNLGSQMGAGLKSMLGGELKGMTKALVASRQEVMDTDVGGGGGEGRERDRRHALRHVRDGRACGRRSARTARRCARGRRNGSVRTVSGTCTG